MLLSRRTVHFTKDQLFWQFQTLCYSEDGLVQDDAFPSLRDDLPSHALDFKDRQSTLLNWWTWIYDYTSRDITYNQGCLPAIAGIPRYFADGSGMTPAWYVERKPTERLSLVHQPAVLRAQPQP